MNDIQMFHTIENNFFSKDYLNISLTEIFTTIHCASNSLKGYTNFCDNFEQGLDAILATNFFLIFTTVDMNVKFKNWYADDITNKEDSKI